MKGRHQKRRALQLQQHAKTLDKPSIPPLEIKFNLNSDLINCFVGIHPIAKNNYNRILEFIDKPKTPPNEKPQELSQCQSSDTDDTTYEEMKITYVSKDQLQKMMEEQRVRWSSAKADFENRPYQGEKEDWFSPSFWGQLDAKKSQLQKYKIETAPKKINFETYYCYDENGYYLLSPQHYAYSHNFKQIVEIQIIPQHIIYDSRTSLILHNLLNKYTKNDLLFILKTYSNEGTIDFLKVTGDNQIVYAYINFVNTVCLHEFFIRFHSRYWRTLDDRFNLRYCYLTYSDVQGLENLILRFGKEGVVGVKRREKTSRK